MVLFYKNVYTCIKDLVSIFSKSAGSRGYDCCDNYEDVNNACVGEKNSIDTSS